MAGIYIHIPFCKQACHYCDFHFSTSVQNKTQLLEALVQEIQLRQKDWQDEPIETIYFGGGTPSVLTVEELHFLLDAVYANFQVIAAPEITLEANPDDLSPEYLLALSQTKINRLSIGIQSFFDADLQLMNRAHNAEQAKQSLALATQYFDNITLDLIYGMPNMTNDQWLQNIETALSYGIPHISCYALTVEPKTALQSYIQKGQMPPLDEALAAEHFKLLVKLLEANGFVHYEFSNFGKPNYFSQNNSSYWLGKKYLGIGPSAHSFDGQSRSWNVSNNAKYIKAIQSQELHPETEILSLTDRYNEYIMTGLRTIWGVSLDKVEKEYGVNYINYLNKQIQSHVQNGLLKIEDGILTTTAQGKFLGDGIAADLFFINNN
ncbi:MAG: radical SAM family heme chaperone HemW [Flavobacterium sp.]|nr:radical SAM family heme chaperone HemW [Flavobacterium sp.]